MRLEDLREAIMENITRDDLTSERINRHINNTLQRIARYHNWKDLYVKATTETIANQSEYSLPLGTDRLKDLVSITLSDGSSRGVRLKYVPYRQFHEIIPVPSSGQLGKPQHYAVWDNVIQLYPTPNDIFTLNLLYVKWPDKLVDGEEPEITGVDDLIIAGATSSLFMSLQQVEPAGIWHQQFNVLLNEAIQADVKNTDAEFKMQGFRASDISVPAQNLPM